jgi:phage repressor protein C with HTH and peptisase S24 domain
MLCAVTILLVILQPEKWLTRARLYQYDGGTMIDVEKLKKARDSAKLSQKELAKKAGVSQQLIGEIERGAVLSSKSIYKIAIALGVGANHLDPAIPAAPTGVSLVPVVGYIGAGAEIFTIDDHHKGAGLDEVEAPPGCNSAGVVALRVRGASMVPAYKDGDLIFYDQKDDGDFDHLVGKDCVIHLSDGRTFLKELRRTNGDFWLHSHNADPILHPQIMWAARVRWVEKA